MTQSGGAKTGFQIFPAGPSDAEDLSRVHVKAWRESYKGLLPDAYLSQMSEIAHARRFSRALLKLESAELILAAADRAGLVGYAAACPSRRGPSGEGEISTLYVLKSAQGYGLGAALLTGAARALAAQGLRSLVISVLRDNQKARGFYEHLGGVADAPRAEPGPGGLVQEVAYRWADIATLK